jgi:hypothetical protein
LVFFLLAITCLAQTNPNEHAFSQDIGQVRTALDNLPGGKSGPLPTLEGFVASDLQDPERYQRPYYQYTVRLTANPSGGARVRVSARISAWHSDGAHSGYVLLKSSGRLETDLLDRLQKALDDQAAELSGAAENAGAKTKLRAESSTSQQKAEISAPTSQFPKHLGWTPPQAGSPPPTTNIALENEARNLEDILRNQGHPTNLVAVKTDQTPVLQAPSLDGKVLFLASVEDEFELLETMPDWVHVRISGLSRGWIRKSAIQRLDGSTEQVQPDSASGDASQRLSTASGLFTVGSDEVGTFPGDWSQLKGRNVKIVSVQQAAGTGRITSPQDKLHFAESIFQKGNTVSGFGLVVIFDSEDGGMIAATNTSIEQWKKGAIRENDFWKQCYIDPPEMLGSIQ